MRFGYMPGHSTTQHHIVCQLQEKSYAINKILYMALVGLEKAFDRVPRRVIWGALHKPGVEEWLVRPIQSPLLFTAVLKAFSQEFSTGCPWENLNADDLVIITGWTTGEADPLGEQHGRKGTTGQNWQNQGRDIWDRAQSAPGVWLKYPWRVSQGIPKKCSGIPGPLKLDASFKCKQCTGQTRPIDGTLMREVTVGR